MNPKKPPLRPNPDKWPEGTGSSADRCSSDRGNIGIRTILERTRCAATALIVLHKHVAKEENAGMFNCSGPCLSGNILKVVLHLAMNRFISSCTEQETPIRVHPGITPLVARRKSNICATRGVTPGCTRIDVSFSVQLLMKRFIAK